MQAANDADNAANAEQGSAATQFKPGQSGNPAGRPKGARSKLTDAFIRAMCEDFETHGAEVIEKVRAEKPDQYLKIIAAIIPKEITGEDGEPIPYITAIHLVGVPPTIQ